MWGGEEVGVGEEGLVDDDGESAFEGPHCFFVGVAAGDAPVEEAACWRLAAGLGEGDAVDGGDELAVPGATIDGVLRPRHGPLSRQSMKPAAAGRPSASMTRSPVSLLVAQAPVGYDPLAVEHLRCQCVANPPLITYNGWRDEMAPHGMRSVAIARRANAAAPAAPRPSVGLMIRPLARSSDATNSDRRPKRSIAA